MITIHNHDAVAWARGYTGEKFHAMLCDPPYHLTTITKRFGKSGAAPARFGKDGAFSRVSKGFMGNEWDGGDLAFRPETWEVFGSVLYPGAFGMAFASSRGWHRMAVAIEDAGFIIHPTIFGWAYASGFPKATRVKGDPDFDGHRYGLQALKPAVEPIIVFQRPYEGRPLDNIVETGAGTLNIDAGRIGTDEIPSNQWSDNAHPFGGGAGNEYRTVTNKGRWPSNFILEDPDAAGALDKQTGELTSGKPQGIRQAQNNIYGKYKQGMPVTGFGDSGGASRFFYNVQTQIDEADPVFYQAKASGDERSAGLGEMPLQPSGVWDGRVSQQETRNLGKTMPGPTHNPHPTVKPIDLARYLASLLLPPAKYAPRRLFIPFSGVGSECIGAHIAGWDEITGVESDTKNNYIEIARKRIDYWVSLGVQLDLFKNSIALTR